MENKVLETRLPGWGAHLEASPEREPPLQPKPFLDFFFKREELVQNGKHGEMTLLLSLGLLSPVHVHNHQQGSKGEAGMMHWW